MQVTNLSECRDLLKAWECVRGEILKGHIRGWAICLADWGGGDRVLFAGEYLTSKGEAASAALRLSWEITKEVDRTGSGF
jgi:hypothetical protein